MSEEQLQTAKPQKINNVKFKSQANEYMAKLEEFKKLEKKMKQYESNIKQFMIDNGISLFETEHGTFSIVARKVNVLNKSLIDDIDQYYEEVKRVIMYKSLN